MSRFFFSRRLLPVGLPAAAVLIAFMPAVGVAPGLEALEPQLARERAAEDRLAAAVASIDAGQVDAGTRALVEIAADEPASPRGAAARLRLASLDIAAGRPESALCRIDAVPVPAELLAASGLIRARALDAAGRTEDAAQQLESLLAAGGAPASAENLALALVGRKGPAEQTVSAGAQLRIARLLAERGSSDPVRGGAFLGTLLPALRGTEDWVGYRAALLATLRTAPLSVLRTRGIPRDARTATDLATVAHELTAGDRLARAGAIAGAGDSPTALAELGRIDTARASAEERATARALEAELLLRVGRPRDAVKVVVDLDAPTAELRDRLALARARAVVGDAARAPRPPEKRLGRSRSKSKKAAPTASVPAGFLSSTAAREEALALLAGIDRDDALPRLRREALEATLSIHLATRNLAAALPLFVKKESHFPESSAGRDEIWAMAFPLVRDGDPLSALPMLDALAASADVAVARRGAYWGARARFELGKIDEAAAVFEELASSPASDFWARQSARRLAEVGREASPRPWHFPPDDSDALAALLPPAAQALERVGLWKEALEEIPDSPDLPLPLRVHRVELVSRSGQRDLAMHLLKQIHPAIQTAAVAKIPERELRLFYPLAFEEELRRSAHKYDLGLASLVGVVRQESGFRTVVRSSAGALGIMQIMPATARALGRRMYAAPVPAHRLADPDLSIEMGSFFLRDLIDRLGGEWELALAGYNCGPGRVARVKKLYPEGDVDLWIESLPFAETRDYVKKIVLYESVYRQLYPHLTETDPRPGVVAGR